MKEWAYAMMSIGGIFIMISAQDGLNINFLALGLLLFFVGLAIVIKRKKD